MRGRRTTCKQTGFGQDESASTNRAKHRAFVMPLRKPRCKRRSQLAGYWIAKTRWRDEDGGTVMWAGDGVEDAFHRLSVRDLAPMADTKSRVCREPPDCREAISHKENIRQAMHGRELSLWIDEDTDLNRLAYRAAHVNFRPQNVGSDNITIRKSKIEFLVGSTFPETVQLHVGNPFTHYVAPQIARGSCGVGCRRTFADNACGLAGACR